MPVRRTDERSVEVPWLLERIGGSQRILDVGLSKHGDPARRYLERLPAEREIWVIDPIPAPAWVPAWVTAVWEDVCTTTLPSGAFDLILCISTIEHVGYAGYGLAPYSDGPARAMREMRRLLVPGGRLLLTAPLGRAGVRRWPDGEFWMFDWAGWQALCEGWDVVSHTTWRLVNERYHVCRPEALADAEYLATRAEGVVATELRRPADA